MLLRHVTMRDLAAMFASHASSSAAPYLKDPDVVRRARRLARKNGRWKSLDALDPQADVVAFKGSWFRQLRQTKDRRLAEYLTRRSEPLAAATVAVWLGHPGADLDYLQDLLWAYCEDSTWVHAVHDHCRIDLNAAETGATLAEAVHIFGDRLDPAVRERIVDEVDSRVFRQFSDYRSPEVWKTGNTNWNLVCNGSIVRAALYLIDDPDVLANLVHAAIQNLTFAVDGFTDDGGCVEGPAYWNYGFGHYLRVAEALHQRTGGELDITADAKIERICRYPLAAHIDGSLYSTFADSTHGDVPAWIALLVNRFHAAPELYELCARNDDHSLRLSTLLDLALYDGERATGTPDTADYELPDLGQVKLRGRPGPRQLTVMALAGHNGVSHNHNDVGSFLVHRDGALPLVDPGAPMYDGQTFSDQRYEIIYCRSRGHSVPVINGREQRAGARYRGTLETAGLNGDGPKRAIIDMTRAYPRGTMKRLLRTLELDPRTNRLELRDDYTFGRAPRSLEEAFITFDKVTLAADRRSVRIGTRATGVEIRPLETEGRFALEILAEESRAKGRTDDIIHRITFTPKRLAADMSLRFTIG